MCVIPLLHTSKHHISDPAFYHTAVTLPIWVWVYAHGWGQVNYWFFKVRSFAVSVCLTALSPVQIELGPQLDGFS
jgi:hypothetical protein